MDSQSDHASTARPGAQDRTQEKEIRPVGEHKYTVASTGSRIEEFLDIALDDMDMDVEYEVLEGVHTHPDLEDPDVVVKFSGPEVDLLLANKAEVLLALEFLTMEALRMPP